ncbi:phytoene desaturase family protein, partial [Prevotella sp.]|uniref:phytoene desaturase family protein n=1 Tax=Prevotella sp. TaxID=59823 RepID=UPI002F9563EF
MGNQCVIIGSGLGGLSCGVVLAKNGYNVTIIEQHHQIGGCLQCFSRAGVKFESGMHFIGSASKGQTLDRLLRYLEVKDQIPLSQLDPSGYNIIALGGREYRFTNGRDNFLRQMSAYFPDEEADLTRYYDLIERVAGASRLHSLSPTATEEALDPEFLSRSINDVMAQTVANPTLRNVLMGALPLYAAEQNKTPFATHAFVTDFYNQSA